ncbi:MAG: sulfoxide reductase heme-binding subunit YedZ, partial [Methylophilaceae bacterium]|nr:sulfoxide reductase heme-binding subunit YedZ [Methylophilaceae bacterium]
STNGMMRRLGARWKQLHYTVYIVAILGVLHFWWLVKKDIREPLLYAIILFLLLGIRLYYKLKKQISLRESAKDNLQTKSIA